MSKGKNMIKKCTKYEAYSTFASEKDFFAHLQECEDCKKEYEKELRLSVLIQDSAETYKAMTHKNNTKKMMCKIACMLVIFTSFGAYTGFEVKQHQRFSNFVKANTETSIIAQEGLPTDEYGFFDYN